jgi:hypothetical protein
MRASERWLGKLTLLRRRRKEEYGGYVLGPQEEDWLGWEVRSFVYAHLVEHRLPPTAEQTSAGLGIEPERARADYERLHARHALFLDPETREVPMAFPFSGVPTPFRVRSKGRSYWANCAWDMLGIPAALHSDADAEAEYAEDDSPAHLSVEDGWPLSGLRLVQRTGDHTAWTSPQGVDTTSPSSGAEIGETDGERSVARGGSLSR